MDERKKERLREVAWARYERRERENRESESVFDGAAVPSRVFSTIRLKRKFERGYRARVCVVKAVRNRADFTSYRAVIVVRKAESFELQEVGAIAVENRGLNETDRPRYAASFHLSVHSVNDDARLPRIFANRDTRNVPLDVKG